jgi:hypothetical protein
VIILVYLRCQQSGSATGNALIISDVSGHEHGLTANAAAGELECGSLRQLRRLALMGESKQLVVHRHLRR